MEIISFIEECLNQTDTVNLKFSDDNIYIDLYGVVIKIKGYRDFIEINIGKYKEYVLMSQCNNLLSKIEICLNKNHDDNQIKKLKNILKNPIDYNIKAMGKNEYVLIQDDLTELIFIDYEEKCGFNLINVRYNSLIKGDSFYKSVSVEKKYLNKISINTIC